jgi:hypothetical protein
MQGVNLERQLQVQRTKLRAENSEEVLRAFQQIIADDDQLDRNVLANIFGSDGLVDQLDLNKLDPKRIYGVAEIKKICVDYRLRFLDAKYFKGEIPYEAVKKVKALQKDQHTELKGFKMIAPAPMFKLVEKDKDPLLFINLGNGMYYLVHKWGKDLNIFRRALVYPFRRFESLFTSVIALAFVIAAAVPSEVMMGPKDTTSMHIRVIFFFYLFLAFSGLTALYGFSRMKNFSVALWKSKYFD